jgi:hypothetical protein
VIERCIDPREVFFEFCHRLHRRRQLIKIGVMMLQVNEMAYSVSHRTSEQDIAKKMILARVSR